MTHGVKVRKVCRQCGKVMGEHVYAVSDNTDGPVAVTATQDDLSQVCDTCSFFGFLADLPKQKEKANVRAV